MKKQQPTRSFQRYGIRKFSQGVASVMIASGMFFLGSGAVYAEGEATPPASEATTGETNTSGEADKVAADDTNEAESTVNKDELNYSTAVFAKLLNNANLTEENKELKESATTELKNAQALLESKDATQEAVDALNKKIQELSVKVTLEIPLSKDSQDAIDNAEVSEGVGVLTDKSQTATPNMENANGASLKDQEPVTYEGVKLQPTAVADHSTFAYGGLYYLKFAGIDLTTPKLASTYYVRGSRNTKATDDNIVVEIVNIKDNTVAETLTLKPGETVKSTVLAVDSRIPGALRSQGFTGDNHIIFHYDNSIKTDTTLGKLGYYLSHPFSAWAMGTYEIPREAKYITKYMTTTGEELATYTIKGWSNQLSTPSEKREFTNYEYVGTFVKGTPEYNIDEVDSVERLAQQYNAKLLRRVVKPDGTVIKTFYIKDPTLTNDQAAPAAGSDTTGYIKVFETDEIAPGQTNTKLTFFYGNDTLMSNGKPLITEEAAKEIADKAKNTPANATANTVRVYTDDATKSEADQKSIDIGFVGYNDAARPYGVVEPGKTLYIRNRNVTYVNAQGNTVSGPNNFQLVPLYNELLYVPEVVHLYERKGNVDVTYVDVKGNKISGTTTGIDKQTVDSTEAALTNVAPKTAYDTTDLRPETITTADGKIYYFKELNTEKSHYDNGTPDGENPNDDVFGVKDTGEVRPGTTHVVYTYEQAGSVVVKYVDVEGNPIYGKATGISKDTVASIEADVDAAGKEVTNVKPGTEYSTVDLKPTSITTEDGTVYYLVSKDEDGKYTKDGLKVDSDAETGEVEAGKTKEVTYVYEQAGSVTINYITTDGTVIKQPVSDVKDGKPGDAYNAAENDEKPATITVGDKVYKLVTKAGTTTGTTPLTYNDKGVVTATADGTSTINNNPIGGETGTVAAGQTTEVTYVYEEAKGNVVVKYETTDGTQLSGELTLDKTSANVDKDGVPVPGAIEASGGTSYDSTRLKPTTITTKDGKVYKLVAKNNGLKDGSAPENGDQATVIAGETRTVTYVYEEVKGDVTVKYIDDQGNELAGTATMPDNSTEAITTDGIKVADQQGLDKNYDTTTKKATRIVTADGKVYELAGDVNNDKVVAKDSVKEASAAEKGNVKEELQTVTYVYKEVKGSVEVKYVDAAGNPIFGTATGITKSSVEATETDTKDASAGTDYDTTDLRPATITVKNADGTESIYYYKEVKAGSADEKGKVNETTQTVTYVYEQAGSVTINYITTDGTVIKQPVTDVKNAKPGDAYNAAEKDASTNLDEKPTYINTNGKVYKLVTKVGKTTGATPVDYNENGVATSGTDVAPETGKVVAGKDLQVTYVYEEVEFGNVVVRYVVENEDGTTTEIQSTYEDTQKTEVGTAYNTAENASEKPQTITKDGKVYELVRVEGVEQGSVVAGTTTVTYIYKEKATTPPTQTVTTEWVTETGEVLKAKTDGTHEAGTFEGYEFVRTEVDAEGNTKHIFKKVTPTQTVTTEWVTETGEVLKAKTDGTHEAGTFEGYEFVRTEVDAEGNTKHIFKKVTPTQTVTTEWVTETGEVLKAKTDGTHEAGTFEGYEFVRTEVDAEGNTKHIFKKVMPAPTTPARELPNTGSAADFTVFGAAASAIIAGLGMVVPGKKEEQE